MECHFLVLDVQIFSDRKPFAFNEVAFVSRCAALSVVTSV